MVFKKLSINGKSYGDYVDEAENPIEITEVNIYSFLGTGESEWVVGLITIVSQKVDV